MIQPVANINRAIRKLGMADESEYFIKIDDFSEDAFIVESIEVSNWNLAEADYSLRIKLLALEGIDAAGLIGKHAVIHFLWRGAMAPLHTYIHQVYDANGNDDYSAYQLILKSPLWNLKNQQHNRVFIGESSLQIAKTLLTEFVDGSFPVTVHASDVEPYPMTVQYQETDWDFIHRILLRDGIMLHQHQGSQNLEVLLFDDVTQLPLSSEPIELPFRSARGAAIDEEYVSLVKRSWRQQPQSIQVADYQFPKSDSVFGQKSIESAQGVNHFRWGDNIQNSDSAQKLADNLSTAFQAQSQSIIMHSNCRGLQPGMCVLLTGHQELSGQYLIIKMELSGNQGAAVNSGVQSLNKGYENVFIAVPAGKPFLPVYNCKKPIATSITATIASDIDEAGLYRVKLPFDERPQGEETSLPTRLLQPFGGADHGMHFPLTIGTEVVLTFENGDVDRPTIIGAVYNDQSPNVVTNENPYHNLIRTRGKHEFLLDDTPGQEKIQLNTAEQKNRLQLNATEDSHLAELHTEEGDLELFAGKSMQAKSGADMNVDVGGNHEVTVKGDYSLMTEEGDILQQSGANMQLTAQENLSWVTEEGQLNVEVAGQWIVEAADGISTHVVSGDQSTVVEAGSFSVEASENVSFNAGGSITLTQGSGSIQIDSSGNLTLDGPGVEITADKIIVKGGTVGNN